MCSRRSSKGIERPPIDLVSIYRKSSVQPDCRGREVTGSSPVGAPIDSRTYRLTAADRSCRSSCRLAASWLARHSAQYSGPWVFKGRRLACRFAVGNEPFEVGQVGPPVRLAGGHGNVLVKKSVAGLTVPVAGQYGTCSGTVVA
jgi:hypothetical protein